MAYIGKGLVGVLSENKAVDTMSNPNGVLTTMTLSRTPGSVNNVEVYIDGVFQTPGDEFTLAGDVLTFTTAPETNAVVIAVVGNDSTIANVDNNSITGTMFPDGSVTDSKITDIVSTKISGTLPALDGSSLTNLTTGNLEGTLPALDGSPLTGVSGFRKNASDPLSNSNGNQGDVWVNTASGEMYVLTDATTNANVWTNVGEGTGDMPYVGMVATGGTITTDGDYKVHTFNSSGTFEITTLGTDAVVDTLVVAGGGGGGYQKAGGGGGGGGLIYQTGRTITAGTKSINIGGGGAGGTGSGSVASNGDDSTFDGLTAKGGGGATDGYGSAAAAGGSGGGGGTSAGANNQSAQSGDSGTYGFGFDGGTGITTKTNTSGGGGGGGSAEVGQSGDVGETYGGDGGDGKSVSITGSAVNYAGGGGGSRAYAPAGTGGLGGGGNGFSTTQAVTAGSVNTGGGGGGDAGNGTPKAGGSGIVIIRYKFQ